MTTYELSREDIIAEISRVVRLRLGAHMDAATVINLYRQGRLATPGDIGDALVLADLLSADDPFLADASA